MASRSGRQEETGDRSRESRREADGHIDDFVSSPVGRRSPTTAAGPPERHRIASASPTPTRRQQGGATAPFPGTGRGPPARRKGSSPGEIGVGFTTAQLEQLAWSHFRCQTLPLNPWKKRSLFPFVSLILTPTTWSRHSFSQSNSGPTQGSPGRTFAAKRPL